MYVHTGGLEQQGKKIKVDEDNVTKNSYGNVEKGLVKETNPEVIKKGPTDNASSGKLFWSDFPIQNCKP